MTYIPDGLRRQVVERALEQCEYCCIHQDDRLFAHEIDHIYAEKHGGLTQIDNLCLACGECNRYKSSDLCSLDLDSGAVVALFHPRRDGILEALTPTARVTARLLHFNDPDRVDRRRLLIEAGRYPSA